MESICFICRALNTGTTYLYISPYSRQEIEICGTCFTTRLDNQLRACCSVCRVYKPLTKVSNEQDRRVEYRCEDCLQLKPGVPPTF